MLFTVTTVKDSRANVERFVARNLAQGVDHMFLFLDAPDPEVEAFLEGHPHVTFTVTDKAYWGGDRPEDLNNRQVLNSNLVNGVLAPFAWATWLFHIDADEVVHLDRDRLLAEVPASRPFVRLESVEAVSQRHWDGEVTHFKRLLTPAELQLLAALDLIDEADNRAYFRGHTHGKLGVRPGLELRLQLHRVVDEDGDVLPPYTAPWLSLLHYESHDGEEFVRKWMAHVSAGTLRFRPHRERLLTALTTLVRIEGLTPERRHHYLMRLYDRWVQDDLETLDELGLLIRPAAGSRTPQPVGSSELAQMRSLFDVLVRAPKDAPDPKVKQARMVDLLDSVAGDLDPAVAALVTQEVKRARRARPVVKKRSGDDSANPPGNPSARNRGGAVVPNAQNKAATKLGTLAQRFGKRS